MINAKCTIRVCYGPRNPLFTGVFFELAGLKAATDAPDGPGKRCGYHHHHHHHHPCTAAPLLRPRRRLKTKGKSKREGGRVIIRRNTVRPEDLPATRLRGRPATLNKVFAPLISYPFTRIILTNKPRQTTSLTTLVRNEIWICNI